MLALLVSLALSAPLEVTHQGRLMDVFGVPYNGNQDVEFLLYDSHDKTNMLYSTGAMPIDFVDGYYAVRLGPLPETTMQSESLWLEIEVDDTPLSPMHEVGAVPFSGRADAASWTSLTDVPAAFSDGVDDVLTESAVDNYVSNNGFITEVQWNAIQGVPSDLADGDDVLTETQVDAMVANNGFLTGVTWSQVAGKPSGFEDGVDNTLSEGDVDSMVANNGYLTSVNWSQVAGKPAGFADGVDNTLSEGDVDGMVANNGYLTSVSWSQISGKPAGFNDGIDNTVSESTVDGWVSNNGYVTNVSRGGHTNTVTGGNGGEWGNWSGWAYCPTNTFVCGLRTKVEGDQGWNGDDTAMNDVQLACCTINQ